MDKKDLNAIVTGMVTRVSKEQNVPEVMARALVGFALMQNASALVASIKSPKLAIGRPTEYAQAFGDSEPDLFPG